jgi:hypothetical protein
MQANALRRPKIEGAIRHPNHPPDKNGLWPVNEVKRAVDKGSLPVAYGVTLTLNRLPFFDYFHFKTII